MHVGKEDWEIEWNAIGQLWALCFFLLLFIKSLSDEIG